MHDDAHGIPSVGEEGGDDVARGERAGSDRETRDRQQCHCPEHGQGDDDRARAGAATPREDVLCDDRRRGGGGHVGHTGKDNLTV